MMNDSVIEVENPKNARTASDNVDQLELRVLTEMALPLDSALFDETVSDSILDEVPVSGGEEIDDFANAEFRLDSLAGDMETEIQRRRELLAGTYPFRLTEGTFSYTGGSNLIYEFCLAITQAPTITTGSYCDLPREFERLTGSIAKFWLGESASSYRAGWPPDGDRPSKFKETIEELHDRSGEWWWQERDERYDDPTEVKDGGVDVVVWRHPDSRVGGVFMLGQCACGNNWNSKFQDLSPDLIQNKYVRDISVASELRFFSTPFHVPHSKTWLDTSLAAGIVFDRARLVKLGSEDGCLEVVQRFSKHQLDDLIRLVVPRFQTA